MHMVLAIWLNGQPRSTVRYCGTVHARFAPACPSAFFASMAHAQCESTAFHVRCCTPCVVRTENNTATNSRAKK